MKKIRYKRKKNNIKFIVISTFIILLTITTGYAIFAQTLKINGSASIPKYVSPNLIPQLTLSSGRYITGTYGQNVQWASESYDGKNNLTVYLTRRNTQTTLRTTTLNINNLRNVYPLSLTSRSASRTIVAGSGNISSATASTGTATIASNGTTYFRLVLSMRTSVAGPIEVLATYRYTYDGVYKYFYLRVIVT